ncbi:MAG: hypothetical protein WC887_01020 [Candidatus Paceibacterota bacterium]|jgi:NADH:ubiquinone oxidoreductase subunit 2 (subunit N)
MKKAIVFTSVSLVTLALPLISLAAPLNNISDVGKLIIDTINNILVPVLFAIAFIVFLYGAFKTFIMGANSGDAQKEGKELMIWSLVGFFVMVSIWGLVGILTGTVSFGGGGVNLPTTR